MKGTWWGPGSPATTAGMGGSVWAVAFSPDGRTALSGSTDRTLILWEVATGEALRTFSGHTGAVTSVAFSPDGRTALSGSGDSTLILWEVATGEVLRTFSGHTWVVESVAFSPDGRTALSGSRDSTLILWDVATGEALRTFSGHTDVVLSVAFSPDGRTALSGSCGERAMSFCAQGEMILWDVATGVALRTFTGHIDSVLSVAFSPDGRTALSGSRDYTLSLWRVDTLPELMAWACANRVVELSDEERRQYGIPDDAPTCPQFTASE